MEITIIIKTHRKIERMTVMNDMTIQRVKDMYFGKVYSRNDDIWFFKHRKLEDFQTISDSGIKDLDIIEAHSNLKGGGVSPGLYTIDISKNKTKILKFDINAPRYRTVHDGLNIQGKCGNKDCEAHNKIVYCIVAFTINYDIITNLEKGNIKCPACDNDIYPLNYGFLHCKYKIDFTKWENNKKISDSVKGEAGNEFKVFSESSGNANFTKLIFTVTPNY